MYRRSSLSNDDDRALLLARPELLDFADAAVLEGRTGDPDAAGHPGLIVRSRERPTPAGWQDPQVVSHDDIRSIALGLPEAEERASYGGRPSWRTKTRMFAWIRDDPEALVVWVDSEEEKLALVASEPGKFFTTPHYDGHPIVLVRLEAVDLTEARELVTESWRLRAARSLVKAWDAKQQ